MGRKADWLIIEAKFVVYPGNGSDKYHSQCNEAPNKSSTEGGTHEINFIH